MTDRMKEALFSVLDDVSGLRVLDLFAGSGSLGLEALSRGAISGIFVDSARDAVVSLEANIEATGLSKKSEVIWADVASTLSRPPDERMDLIFVDPPYSMTPHTVQDTLEMLVMGGFLADNGRVVLHRPQKERQLSPLGLSLSWERDYGQSTLQIFEHEEEAS
jgi:16S rRNA (guanine966-N2)-methyltransferase